MFAIRAVKSLRFHIMTNKFNSHGYVQWRKKTTALLPIHTQIYVATVLLRYDRIGFSPLSRPSVLLLGSLWSYFLVCNLSFIRQTIIFQWTSNVGLLVSSWATILSPLPYQCQQLLTKYLFSTPQVHVHQIKSVLVYPEILVYQRKLPPFDK